MNKKDVKKQSEGALLDKTTEFEIHFYESILRRKPDFIEALIAVGNLYTKKGYYNKGLAVDEKLFALRPDDPVILYNLACSYSLVGDLDRSLSTIKSAIYFGYEDLGYMERDRDLQNLRQDIRFQQFISNIRKSDPSDRKL